MTHRLRPALARFALVPFASLVLLAVGCSTDEEDAGVDNYEACTEYVDSVNAEYAECELPEGLDKDENCDKDLNEGDTDCRDFYECRADAFQCDPDAGTVSSEGASDCGGCD